MLRLLLLRHAKSSWDEPGLADFDRPLNARGRQAAPLVGRYMVENALQPARVLSSTARRARETLALILPILDAEMTIDLTRDLYDSIEADYVTAIQAVTGGESPLMVVGHNPAMEDTAHRLVGESEPGLIGEMERKYPTGALAVIDFDVPAWSKIAPGTGVLKDFVQPRGLSD